MRAVYSIRISPPHDSHLYEQKFYCSALNPYVYACEIVYESLFITCAMTNVRGD